jgi:hypothetical protein
VAGVGFPLDDKLLAMSVSGQAKARAEVKHRRVSSAARLAPSPLSNTPLPLGKVFIGYHVFLWCRVNYSGGEV